jgi:hypothetical protein
MKKTIGLALSLGVIVAVLGVFLVGPALAQTPAPSTPAAPAAPSTPAAPAGPQANGRFGAGYQDLAKVLGMSVQDVIAARENGQTLSEIGKSKNVTDQQITDALVSAHKTAIDQALTNGRITQAQHDWLLQAAQTMAQLQLTNPFPLGRGGSGFMMGGGMMGGGMMGRNGSMMGGRQGYGNGDNESRGFNRFQGMPGRGMRGGNKGFGFDNGRGGDWSNKGNQPGATPAPSITPSGSSGA